MNKQTVAFIGAGKISESWIERLINSGVVSADQITACDPNVERLTYLQKKYSGLRRSTDNLDGARFGRLIVIAAPPPDVVPALARIRPALQERAIVISLAAGVALKKLAAAAPEAALVRIMPNTPSMVGEGMNLVCYVSALPEGIREQVESLLKIFGHSLEIEEGQMEAYGALCSVGPTFLFPIVQSLVASAVEAGLPESSARMAAAQVFIGTGQLVAASGRSVAELNGMIGLHTLAETQAMQLVTEAYKQALEKLKDVAAKMAAVA